MTRRFPTESLIQSEFHVPEVLNVHVNENDLKIYFF